MALPEGVAPFEISIDPVTIAELRTRLARPRLADVWPHQTWSHGIPTGYLAPFLETWGAFDWATAERELNELPHFVTQVDGVRIHFLWFRCRQAGSLPILMAHGWPSSALEFVEAARTLSAGDPTTEGDDLQFDVVIPSLPGYLFSDPGPAGTSRSESTARLWDRLMARLGYERYWAHGDDLGGGITVRLGTDCPDRVAAIHIGPNGASAAARLLAPTHPLISVLDGQERRWDESDGAYGHQQRTKPLTIAHALSDSPAALASWVLEKWHAWTETGGLQQTVSPRHLMVLLTLYWCTPTVVTSLLPYWERSHLPRSRPAPLNVPTGIVVTREPGVSVPPRELLEAAVPLRSWIEVEHGGHFLFLEQPQLAAGLMRDFYRTCVTAGPASLPRSSHRT